MINFNEFKKLIQEIPLEDYRDARLRDLDMLQKMLRDEIPKVDPATLIKKEVWTKEKAMHALSEKRGLIDSFQENRRVYETAHIVRDFFAVFVSLNEKEIADSLLLEYFDAIDKASHPALRAALYTEIVDECLELGYGEYAKQAVDGLGKLLEENPKAKWPQEYGTVKMYKDYYKDFVEKVSSSSDEEESIVFLEEEVQTFVDDSVKKIRDHIPVDEWPRRNRCIAAVMMQIRMAKSENMSTKDLGLDLRAITK